MRVLPPLLLFLFLCTGVTRAQQGPTLSITKVADATTLPSGQQFTYTLTYTWSGGAPGTIIIRDTVPANLQVISTLPAASVVGNAVQFSITGITAGAGTGTVQINVKFPPGVTCNGARACNTAWITNSSGSSVQSSGAPVCVTATAQNKWTMEKSLFAGCAVNDVVIYRICINNPSGGDIGGLNLTNVQVQDIVPAGATLVGVTGFWTGGSVSGTTITLTGGPSTLPVNMYNVSYCAYISIQYPTSAGFAAGQTLVDTAKVTHFTPCDTVKQGLYTDTAKVTLCAANPSGALSKWLSINMFFPMGNPYYYPSFSPGCCGTYTLWYQNTGNVSQPGFVMEDNVPTTLDVTSIVTNVPAGNAPVTVNVYCWSGSSCSATPCTTVTYAAGSHTMTGLPANVCKVRWSYSGSVAPASSLSNQLNVCVRSASYASPFTPVTTGQNILNTVTAQATNLPMISASVTKPVDSLRPKILATKLFMGSGCSSSCQPQTAGPFVPGNIVRWRMAVTNVGNVNATSVTINDLLPSGLTYVGNPTYWYGPSSWMANTWTPACCSLSTSVPSQIGGTITTPSPGDTALVWTFPTLPYRCDGTVEYFVIEFDVMIGTSPPMPPGQYFNNFSISASNHGTVVSNNAQLTVNSIAQLTVAKEVRPKTPTGVFGPTATLAPGQQAEFRLRVKNTGNLTLTNICLLDIMPHTGDIRVIGTSPTYGTRGSQFDMPVASAASVTAPGGYTVGFSNSTNSRNPTRTAVCGGFCGSPIVDPTNGVGVLTPGAFGAFGSSTFAFTASGGTTTLLPGGTLDVFVTSTVPATATPGQQACNSFAVQSTIQATAQCLKVEAVEACVRVSDKPTPTGCDRFWLEGKPNDEDCCGYSFTMANTGGAAVQSLQYNVLPVTPGGPPSGTINAINTSPCSPTSTVPASLAGTTSGMLNFNTACTGASPTSVDIQATSTSATGEICIQLIAVIIRNGQTVDCIDTICFRCPRQSLTRCDSMSVKPFPFHDLDLSGRTFTVYNMKSPASPICSVKIDVQPPPSGPGVNGGGLYVDAVWQSWPFGTSVGYSQILPVHGLPANNTVQFNLGIDYTIGWVGNVTVTAYHCDGDSCTMRYGPWKATKKDIILVGTPVGVPELDSLHVHRLKIDGRKAKGYDLATLKGSYSDEVGRIVALTGAALPCDTSGDCDDDIALSTMKDRRFYVELRRSVDGELDDVELTILYTAGSNRRPRLELVYFDSMGNEAGRDTITVTGLALDDPPGGVDVGTGNVGSLRARPNPTNGHAELGFTLTSTSSVDLQLTDALGRTIAVLSSNERLGAGNHTRSVDMSELPNGSYFVLLRVNGVQSAMRLELMR